MLDYDDGTYCRTCTVLSVCTVVHISKNKVSRVTSINSFIFSTTQVVKYHNNLHKEVMTEKYVSVSTCFNCKIGFTNLNTEPAR